MAVVTISRELGSEGAYIGRKTAEVLGYHFVDKFVIEDLLREYGMVQFIDVYESTPGFWTRFDKMSFELIEMLNKVILALALKGNMVIMSGIDHRGSKKVSQILDIPVEENGSDELTHSAK